MANLYSVISQFTKKMVLSQSGPGGINGRYDYGHRYIFLKTFSLTFSINVSYYFLYQNKSLATKNPYNFIKNSQQMDFNRPVFAMAVLQAPFSLTHWLTDSSFSYCVSHVTCHLSGVSIFLEGLVSMDFAPSSCF